MRHKNRRSLFIIGYRFSQKLGSRRKEWTYRRVALFSGAARF
jgi:hypothetical protein